VTNFHCLINEQTELRLIDQPHTHELFQLYETNRDHVRRLHPWVDALRSPADMKRAIAVWRLQDEKNRGFYAGLWFQGRLCGVINHLNLDWANRWTALSYWLDAGHQGRGLMTAGCRAMVAHCFDTWQLNRITIECAADNTRSRALAERLGFKLEGVVRSVEWLHDHYADHAVYGLLRSEHQGMGV